MYLLRRFPEQARTQGYFYYSLLWPDQLHLLMPCVTSNARMASSAALCLVLPSPSSFMNLLWLLLSSLGFLLPSSCIYVNRCCSLYPTGLLIHRVVSVSHPCLNIEAILVSITLVLRLTGRKQLALSLASLSGTGADALDKL